MPTSPVIHPSLVGGSQRYAQLQLPNPNLRMTLFHISESLDPRIRDRLQDPRIESLVPWIWVPGSSATHVRTLGPRISCVSQRARRRLRARLRLHGARAAAASAAGSAHAEHAESMRYASRMVIKNFANSFSALSKAPISVSTNAPNSPPKTP